MESKNIIYGVVLVAIIIAAAIVIQKRISGGSTAPSSVTGHSIAKIDTKTYEIIVKPFSDWNGKYKPNASGYWKNPTTGEYTMLDTMKCRACGKDIFGPVISPEVAKMAPDDRDTAQKKIQDEYKCPLCGKNPGM